MSKKSVEVWNNYTLGVNDEISEIQANDTESKTSKNPDIQKSENANVQTSENVDIQKTTPEVNKNTLKKGKNGKKKLSYIDRGWETVTINNLTIIVLFFINLTRRQPSFIILYFISKT